MFMDYMLGAISSAYKKIASTIQLTTENSQSSPLKNSGEHGQEGRQSVKVEISDEAKQKKLQESNQQAHRKLMGKDDVEGAETSGDKTLLDEMIAELQEEIAQLSQEMATLRSQGDEQSQSEAKSLELQVASLTAQLMNLLTQKIEEQKTQ